MIIKIKKTIIFVLIVLPSLLWAIKFPENDFFPVGSDVKHVFVSERSNIIELSQRLILPHDWESLGVFVIWNFSFNGTYLYSFNFWANYEREVFLLSISDSFYEKMVGEKILIFSSNVEFKKDIRIGDNIYFTFLSEFKEFTHKQTNVKLSGVIKTKLTLNKIDYFLYFVKGRGVFIIETKDEIFIRRS